jgi:hypothetical protein
MVSGIGLVSFFCIALAAALGFVIGPLLTADNRSEATQKVVQMVMNNVGILTALVLGLLIASAKTNFDTTTSEVEQFSASLTLLDRDLSRLAPEGATLRKALHDYTSKALALTWSSESGDAQLQRRTEADAILDDIQDQLRSQGESENPAKLMARASALQLVGELKRTSRLLLLQQNVRTPRPFLAVVIFWLSMLYLSYALFAPINRTVIAAMVVSAISASIALNVIVDMDQPFVGFVKVSPISVRQALDRMGDGN